MDVSASLHPPSLNQLPAYEHYLVEAERAQATREKYLRDIGAFYSFVGTEDITKEKVLCYRTYLTKHYEDTSTNSMLSALNGFLSFCGREDLRVKQLKIQSSSFLSEEKELTEKEYKRLVRVARRQKDPALSLIIQTLCATGIRISELKDITVKGVRTGEVTVHSKGKRRQVFIPESLKKLLITYVGVKGIRRGPVFLNKQGNPISRHSVWRQMKRLCKQAEVVPSKVFPHNLRHLFARCFYALERDLVKLANILGHASINTTRIYAQETVAAHREAMERMRLIC